MGTEARNSFRRKNTGVEPSQSVVEIRGEGNNEGKRGGKLRVGDGTKGRKAKNHSEN